MKFVSIGKRDRIGYIIINRPEKRNALNSEVVTELKEAFAKLEKDDSVKVLVLKSSGDVFCAGADLEYLQQLQNNSFEENLADSKHLMELFKQIYNLKKVVIAQVNGHAIAGGCGLVSVCDFSFSVPDANFGYSEVKIGFLPAIVMVFLLRKIGEAKAKELLISGNMITASQANKVGLVNWVVDEEDDLEKEVYDFATRICLHNSGTSMELTKQMISNMHSMGLDEALEYATRMNAEARNSEDCKKGISSFLKKIKLEW